MEIKNYPQFHQTITLQNSSVPHNFILVTCIGFHLISKEMILQKISLTLLLVVENLLAVELANKTLGLETVSIVKLWVLSRPRPHLRNLRNPSNLET